MRAIDAVFGAHVEVVAVEDDEDTVRGDVVDGAGAVTDDDVAGEDAEAVQPVDGVVVRGGGVAHAPRLGVHVRDEVR